MTFTTIEAEVDERGQIQAKELLRLPPGSRVLITLLDTPREAETALLSEAALAVDWQRPEEEAAWAGLRPD